MKVLGIDLSPVLSMPYAIHCGHWPRERALICKGLRKPKENPNGEQSLSQHGLEEEV